MESEKGREIIFIVKNSLKVSTTEESVSNSSHIVLVLKLVGD